MKDKIKIICINQSIISALILITINVLGFLFGHSGGFGKSLEDIDINNSLLKPCTKKPNCVSSQSINPKHQIQPFHFFGSIKNAKKNLKKVIDSTGNANFIIVTSKYWHIEFTSRWLGYVDDVEILFYESESRIDIRSASRVGYWDLGVNRKRVEKIRFQFEKIANRK